MTVHFFFQYANIWQIAVTAVIVQAISDDERVGDFKPVVIDRDIYFGLLRSVAILTEPAPRSRRRGFNLLSVTPVSMISSIIRISRPLTSLSRSLRILTNPDTRIYHANRIYLLRSTKAQDSTRSLHSKPPSTSNYLLLF